MGQFSKKTPEGPPDTSSSNMGSTPREECQAVKLRSGKIAGLKSKGSEEQVEKETTERTNEESEHTHSRHPDNPFSVTLDTHPALLKAPKYKLKTPYLQRLQKASKNNRFSKFLEVFKKLQINVPFEEALEQMPLYAKFMKELMSKKRDWKESETVVLTKEYSAIIQKNLTEKLQDPGSFLIPCAIRETIIKKALCDLGASINRISLQLAYHSIKYPLGVIEDLLVKVWSFIFPPDFVILDMEEDKNTSIILRRPFLTTVRALIDTKKGKLVQRVNEEKIVLNVLEASQHPNDSEGCMRVDIIEPLIIEVFEAEKLEDILNPLLRMHYLNLMIHYL
ncbi:uncharacterized protein LOC107465906 [Arachis duranensis]|uniref:Uncharacterized protein LOC107465906 n=1 Tax=Arachis duranensis TaxID=130453 RepID=A0A6P4C5U0_ARADU|nr:uncharacterized protein LOC107465906 [Arachis duranensis]